jgi:LemA protein
MVLLKEVYETMLFIILGVIVVGVLWLILAYNGLVRVNVRVSEAWSDITVQMKRRADLIPNLVNTVKGYAQHEEGVFKKVTELRSAPLDAKTVGEASKAENMFTGALKSLFAVAESYPDLKADKNFKELQDQLVDTENKIQAARRFYNGAVRTLNTKVKVFPTNLFARQLGFSGKEFFEVEDRATIEEPVDVKF